MLFRQPRTAEVGRVLKYHHSMEEDSAIVVSLGLYNLVVERDSAIVILHTTKKEKDPWKFDWWFHQIFYISKEPNYKIFCTRFFSLPNKHVEVI